MIKAKTSSLVRRSEKKRDTKSIGNFLEELSWLLASHSNLDFRAIGDVIHKSGETKSQLSRHVSKNPNIHFLVGTLPSIFSNEKYFPTNEDIADFAKEALRLPIGRWDKRSRYELIGLIVCETVNLDDDALTRLALFLSKIVDDDPNAKSVFQQRQKTKLNWNDIIQQLSLSR